MGVTHFISSPINGHLGCFYISAIRNNTAVNVCVQVFLWTYVFSSPGYVPKSEVVGSYSMLGTVRLFSTAAAPFYIPPSSV